MQREVSHRSKGVLLWEGESVELWFRVPRRVELRVAERASMWEVVGLCACVVQVRKGLGLMLLEQRGVTASERNSVRRTVQTLSSAARNLRCAP